MNSDGGDLASLPENIENLHKQEEKNRTEALRVISGDTALKDHLQTIEASLDTIYAFTREYVNQTEDELTIQGLGIRLFNAGASALSLMLYDEAFKLLKDQYRQAIERIKIPAERGSDRRAPDLRLAQHLMEQYWRGNLADDDPDGLLARFYAKADPKLRSRALDFVGTSLRNTRGAVPAEILQRLQKLWVTRLQAVRAAGPSSPQKEEITAFGWWFASKKLPDSWSLDQVLEVLRLAGSIEPDHSVVERLAQLAASMPAKAVECLQLIIEGDKDGWGVLSWREHARTLLATVIHSADQTARTSAVELIHHLGRRGYPEFRDLLPPNLSG